MNTFGSKLKFLREEKGLMQTQLAKLLYIDKSTISKYENNNIQPSAHMVIIMAKFFNVLTDYLLGLEE